jgi:hypothetical protein
MHNFNASSVDCLQFGHGPHAWYALSLTENDVSPGRFFAITKLKLMLALTLLRFDVKTIHGKRSQDVTFLQMRLLNSLTAEILYKRLCPKRFIPD